MPDRPLVLCVLGTRPEAIKMAPVVQALRRTGAVEAPIVSTGQHRDIVRPALAAFDLAPDVDLDIMVAGQTLAGVTVRSLDGLDRLMSEREPQMVVAQGDTTTVFAAALAAFYRRVPFAHVEAGLRTDRIDDPFPEEFNRRAAGLVADLHFAPTEWAAENLRREGKPENRIWVTGNTGIDAVTQIAARESHAWYANKERIILLTTHRRENWGEPQTRIATAARALVEEFPDTRLVVALHPNPRVRETLTAVLGDAPRTDLIDPPEYARFVKLLQRADLVLTDSGGVQEEAPAFGKPVLVLRETTERPEGVRAGTARLVGTETEAILAAARPLLADPAAYAAMATATSPYGDGHAADRVAAEIVGFLNR